ncbi:MAG: DUF4136 domain-containing protein, partial [Betaproteobacteria bacterium]
MRTLALTGVALLLAACQTTTIRSAWYDTTYNGGVLRKVVVVASDGTNADSRVFEDIFVQKLNAAGVQGIPGYATVSPEARRAEGTFSAAIASTGADAVLMVRLLRVDTKTQVSTMLVPGPTWGPYGGFYGGFYGGPGFYPVADVTQYDVATVETNLYDARTRRLIWAATTETINPNNVAKEAPGFADLLITQFRARGLVPP